MDRKKVRKRSFFPTHCFYTFPGICRRFWPEVLTQTPKNAVFRPRSYSKGPNHALEKVLTKETPCILLMPLLFQILYCIGSFVLLHPEFVCGFFEDVKSLFFKYICRLHFHFTNFSRPLRLPLELGIVAGFRVDVHFLFFRRSALLRSRMSGHSCELICSLLDFLV